MKILILANNDVGLYQFRKELIEELLKNNEVLISLPYGELVEPLKDMGCTFIDTPVDRRGINPITDLGLVAKYYKMIKKAKPDMVVTYTIKPNVYGGFVCRCLKTNYAINITGLGTAFQNEGLLKKLVTFLYKTASKKSKIVFFENVENKQIFVDNEIIKESQSHLLNGAGVNLNHYYFTEYPAESDTTKFLFVGRIMTEKGVNELFEAIDGLNTDGYKCLLDVVGEYEEDYKGLIESYSKKGWLNYHGFQKDVRPFIENSDCFVLPSWHEGMANTNLECASMGRPIITSNIHGCKEAVIENSTGFLCEIKNPDNLYTQLKKFIELPYESKVEMGKQSRIHMENIFDKNKVVAETVKELEL